MPIQTGSRLLRAVLNGFRPPAYVFVLGMHRSGTSSLAGMLKNSGLYLGNVSSRNRYNPKGNQEGYVVSINDALLHSNGSSWKRPDVISGVTWKERLVIEKLRLQMTIDILRTGNRKWGAKDPRMLFCLPAWEEKGIQFVGTFRHPANVALSLRARNGPSDGLDWTELWSRYNLRLLELYRKSAFPIVNFDWEPQRYREAVQRVARHCDLNADGEYFFDETLRHHRVEDQRVDDRHLRLYDRLVEIAEKEERRLRRRFRGLTRPVPPPAPPRCP